QGLAVEVGGELRGLTRPSAGHSIDLVELISLGAEDLADIGRSLAGAPVIDPARIEYLPPLAKPGKIICVGLNYADHTKESPYAQPDYPTLFPRFATSLIGHGQPIVRPLISDSLD
ncbi:fumarylacetoacetate hydrolase family protein, partial [Rhizobiaceae sp. 2RAB30]